MIAAHGGLGAAALVAGLGAALLPKRPGAHVWAGRLFSVGMLLSLVAISVPIVRRANVFMIGLGMVAWFAIIEGWRALRRFRGTLQTAPDLVDYLAVGLTAAAALWLAAFGMQGVLRSGNPLFLVCLAFSGLAAVLLTAAVKRWRRDVSRPEWLAVHIGHMSGALGAAVTAASVVNLEGLFGSMQWVLWVGPTLISTVLGQRAIRARGLT
ncbi:MAG: hypothetical protein KC912_22905 [Proteobacteria bacterium]|nr:hypothetical protein [Pseudomonadota bacterium]